MEKRYFWIKLKESFMSSDTVDFLMGQKNGANYVVLYQMLCLKTVNTNGALVRQIGEVMIPYDVEKIQRDCKYFDYDTIVVAMELYKKLGLIYELQNGYFQIADFENLIGSEGSSAERVRKFRSKALQCNTNVTTCNVTCINKENTPTPPKETNRDIEKDKEKEIEVPSRVREELGTPSLTNIVDEIKSQGYRKVDALKFFHYYEAMGWMSNGKPIVKWKALIALWEKDDISRKISNNGKNPNNEIMQQVYSEEEIASVFRSLDEIDPDTEEI